nr:MAG TPA: hypothetical protein [Caudoviricetes sp.]
MNNTLQTDYQSDNPSSSAEERGQANQKIHDL